MSWTNIIKSSGNVYLILVIEGADDPFYADYEYVARAFTSPDQLNEFLQRHKFLSLDPNNTPTANSFENQEVKEALEEAGLKIAVLPANNMEGIP